ncbi:MAG: exodeoxyribonuclease III [Rickettsiales bacterium]|nr:exodeoxyribonuclease III [Rickettsiales bacterium]MCA0254908.1 exodeoxyribonuclease III [Pseudomonadota bacterium]
MSFKIATWNINSVKMRIPHLLDFITIHDPDIICLQEVKCETEKFPYEEFSHLPYNIYVQGQKSYNGVAILSKIRADEVSTEFPNNPVADQARFIECGFSSPIGYIKVISLYVPNGGEVGSDKYDIKLKFYDFFTDYLVAHKSFDEKKFICSDFNVAPFDIDVYEPKELEHSTCFTYEERRKLRTILNSGFVDNYRIIHPSKQEFSWWDYRAGAFEQNKGMRIDSIISSTNAVSHLVSCTIDYEARTKDKPSDHAPVVVAYE